MCAQYSCLAVAGVAPQAPLHVIASAPSHEVEHAYNLLWGALGGRHGLLRW